MFPNFAFSEKEILAFLMVLIRISAFMVSWPIFSGNSIPGTIKVLVAMSVTMAVFPIVGWQELNQELNSLLLIWLAVKEALVGVILGFLSRLVLFAISASGQMVSTSIGLTSAQVYNPSIGEQASAVDQLQLILASLLLMAFNGHHVFLMGLVQSFEFIPLSTEALNFNEFFGPAQLAQGVLIAGIKISAPVVLAILIANIALGIVGRAVPQLNILITSFAVNIIVGFLILIVSLPLFVGEFPQMFNEMAGHLFSFMKVF